MNTDQKLESQTKRELETREEKTLPGKFYVPYTDIYETEQALIVVMDMPGVDKQNVEVKLEKHVLSIEGRIDFSKYEGLSPVYTEYNVGHFSRSFSIPREIDGGGISAEMADGVMTLKLPKAKEATPRRIAVS